VRYEDLIERPGEAMTELMKFVFGVSSIQGTLV